MGSSAGILALGTQNAAFGSSSRSMGAAVATQQAAPPEEYTAARWYAVYTSPKHEKRVAGQLALRGVSHLLPVFVSRRKWKDRRVNLDLPLFPSYLFVRIALRDRMNILPIPGVVRLVGFNGLPAALDEEEIEALREGLEQGLQAEPHPYLTVGRRVFIKSGPLAGREGILSRWKGNWRVVLSLILLQRSIVVDLDASDIDPVSAIR